MKDNNEPIFYRCYKCGKFIPPRRIKKADKYHGRVCKCGSTMFSPSGSAPLLRGLIYLLLNFGQFKKTIFWPKNWKK